MSFGLNGGFSHDRHRLRAARDTRPETIVTFVARLKNQLIKDVGHQRAFCSMLSKYFSRMEQ